jgi:regulator of replication initiation timing
LYSGYSIILTLQEESSNLRKENNDLRKENYNLQKENYALRKENIYLRKENRQTHKKNTLLQAANNQPLAQSLQERVFFCHPIKNFFLPCFCLFFCQRQSSQ